MSSPVAVDPVKTCRAPRILLIEDDPVDARAVTRGLQKMNGHLPELEHVTSVIDGVKRMSAEPFDLALLDLSLPDCDGICGVRTFHAAYPELPVVVLTGRDDEAFAAQAIREGAQDYLVKSDLQPRQLHRSIAYAIERNAMRRQLDAALQQESELKDRFLSHVSHEMRTPLTAMMQFVTILLDGIAGPLSERQSEYLGIVRRNADQLKRMIATLMDVTRASTGKLTFVMQRIDLGTIVADAVTALRGEADKKRLALQFDPAGEGFEVVADAARTFEVVANLIDNAIKFTPVGGRIQLAVAPDSDPRACRVTVLDNGCGIDPEHHERVFERLHQLGQQGDSSRRGLGLGLHISREIVTRQGGRIWVESQRGRGSRFHFTLPRYSLCDVVRRVAFGGGNPELSVVVVNVELTGDGGRAKGIEAAVRQVETVLANSIVAGTDVVLPGRQPTGSRHAVCALARTKKTGADAIDQRLHHELLSTDRFVRGGCQFTVATWTPDIAVPESSDIDAAVAVLTARVEAKLKDLTEGK